MLYVTLGAVYKHFLYMTWKYDSHCLDFVHLRDVLILGDKMSLNVNKPTSISLPEENIKSSGV